MGSRVALQSELYMIELYIRRLNRCGCMEYLVCLEILAPCRVDLSSAFEPVPCDSNDHRGRERVALLGVFVSTPAKAQVPQHAG